MFLCSVELWDSILDANGKHMEISVHAILDRISEQFFFHCFHFYSISVFVASVANFRIIFVSVIG